MGRTKFGRTSSLLANITSIFRQLWRGWLLRYLSYGNAVGRDQPSMSARIRWFYIEKKRHSVDSCLVPRVEIVLIQSVFGRRQVPFTRRLGAEQFVPSLVYIRTLLPVQTAKEVFQAVTCGVVHVETRPLNQRVSSGVRNCRAAFRMVVLSKSARRFRISEYLHFTRLSAIISPMPL